MCRQYYKPQYVTQSLCHMHIQAIVVDIVSPFKSFTSSSHALDVSRDAWKSTVAMVLLQCMFPVSTRCFEHRMSDEK